MIKLPADNNSTTSAITKPIPVRVTVPIIIPAVPVAIAIPTIFLEPATMPCSKSSQLSGIFDLALPSFLIIAFKYL